MGGTQGWNGRFVRHATGTLQTSVDGMENIGWFPLLDPAFIGKKKIMLKKY